jgi:triacylglycerol lipase
MSHSPAGTTSWNLLHYGQGYTTKKFTAFDMGSSEANMAKYNRPTPPEFMPERITNKYIALYSSLNDWLATPEDVNGLKTRLRVKLLEDFVVPENKWNHMDFIWGKDQGRMINWRIVKLLGEHA